VQLSNDFDTLERVCTGDEINLVTALRGGPASAAGIRRRCMRDERIWAARRAPGGEVWPRRTRACVDDECYAERNPEYQSAGYAIATVAMDASVESGIRRMWGLWDLARRVSDIARLEDYECGRQLDGLE